MRVSRVIILMLVALALAGCGLSGVAIPKLDTQALEQGYALLKSRGFHVSVAFFNGSSMPINGLEGTGVEQTIPAAGTRVAPGSVVTLFPYAGPSASPVGVLHPKFVRLPDFAGRSLGVAMRWAVRHSVYWATRLPPLSGSVARHLWAAYYVTAQRPAAGKRIGEGGWLTLKLTSRHAPTALR